jgi:proteasome lid subunit RPN8/RPN11
VIEKIVLPHALRDRLLEEGRLAFPRECCGLIEGVVEQRNAHATAIHPARNLATDADRFEIDPIDQIRLLRDLRGTGREIIGCYHSHPNGRAEPSQRDRDGAFGEGFLWLIVALAQGEEGLNATLAAFEIGQETVRAVPISAGAIAAA